MSEHLDAIAIASFVGQIPAGVNPYRAVADLLKGSTQPHPIPQRAQWLERCILVGFLFHHPSGFWKSRRGVCHHQEHHNSTDRLTLEFSALVLPAGISPTKISNFVDERHLVIARDDWIYTIGYPNLFHSGCGNLSDPRSTQHLESGLQSSATKFEGVTIECETTRKKRNMLVQHALLTFLNLVVHLPTLIYLMSVSDQEFLRMPNWAWITRLGASGPFVLTGNM
ncbi:hypothetical protein CROQUDRAFT_95533 [Cronartium quercuum f. sp. fusiforme G11]|uniref:Uncharacterized protein n=1 Tax=Cronartium quercuum f. sp. fusiforme G11 TaxID=708437 RepID=A0A9P6NHB8_9BASI|nr:hypothetical protein CROQUDRAFT_95533 [Cronartium quercuum f. sp. fusiforme G11]